MLLVVQRLRTRDLCRNVLDDGTEQQLPGFCSRLRFIHRRPARVCGGHLARVCCRFGDASHRELPACETSANDGSGLHDTINANLPGPVPLSHQFIIVPAAPQTDHLCRATTSGMRLQVLQYTLILY